MRIILAPMEGVVNSTMRAMLTGIGGFDRCVTEFVRITDALLPPRVFYRLCPELHHGGVTPSGVPVYVQLLGGQVEPMALNAQRAAALGAPGVDLNFGCPAKLVNRNDGGSVLLREPERVFDIVRACREATPAATPVTAKIRLGYDDASLLPAVCAAVESAGADELAIHARTRTDGYKPPARWHELAAITARSHIPVIVNGDICLPEHAARARHLSGCQDIMLGRGVLACPDLARQIVARDRHMPYTPLTWAQVCDYLLAFANDGLTEKQGRYVGNRVKQWLGYLRQYYAEAGVLFEQIKRVRVGLEICAALERHRAGLLAAC